MPGANLRKILESKQAKVGRTLFIAIDGRGGSGKSTLANWLSSELHTEIIRTDDFASWQNMFEWWPLVIERVFEPIRSGATMLNYPRSKWWDNHHPQPAVRQPVTPVMILEGVSSSRREFEDYLSLCIFVDTPREICLQRGITRDLVTGKTYEELQRMWEVWTAGEDRYLERDEPAKHADFCVDGTRPFDEQIDFS
jgi:uridine kinase